MVFLIVGFSVPTILYTNGSWTVSYTHLTFATACLQAGCDVKTLSELLGHANANITLQRYVHSDLTRKRREDVYKRQVHIMFDILAR